MEDENITSSAPVEGDVVQVTQTNSEITPAPEPSTPPMEATTETTPATTGTPEYERVAPVPQTEKTLAETYIDDARANAYVNKGHGISDWIKNDYDYDQQQAGTMWVAGKINDVATQMSFLEATLNEDMYGELDLQKYFFDTNLATARAYAKEKKHETAYGWYRAAQEKALAEADLTGWYMPAEANYLLSQWAIAGEKLNDPTSTPDDRARAGSVRAAVSSWFEANNITWRGIECLNHMYYQETVRHNKENERLQDQANQIAAAQQKANAAAAESANNIKLRQFNLETAEMELQWGVDLNKDGNIGHTNWDPDTGEWTGNADRFGWYPTQKLWAQHNLDAAFKLWGNDEMKVILGNDYWNSYNHYRGQIDLERYSQIYSDNGSSVMTSETMNKFGNNKIKAGTDLIVIDPYTGKESNITIKNGNDQLYAHYETNGNIRLYVFDNEGIAHQVSSKNLDLKNEDGSYKIVIGDSNKTPLAQLLNNMDTGLSNDTSDITIKDSEGNKVVISIGQKPYAAFNLSVSNTDIERFKYMKERPYNVITEKEAQGYRLVKGAMSTQGIDTSYVLEKNGKYYEVSEKIGEFKEIKSKDVKGLYIDIDTGNSYITDSKGNKIANNDSNHAKIADYCTSNAIRVGWDAHGNSVWLYTNLDGSSAYVRGIGVYGFDYPSDDGQYDIVNQEELKTIIETRADYEYYNNNSYDYAKGITPEKVENKYTGGSSDDIINKNSEEMSASAKKKAEAEVEQHYSTSTFTDVETPTGTVRNINTSQNNTKKEKTNKTEQSEDQVIQDSSKETETGDLGEKALEETENAKTKKDKDTQALLASINK